MINHFFKKACFPLILYVFFSSFNLILAENSEAKNEKNICAWLDDQNVVTVYLKDKITFNEKTKLRFKVTDFQGKEIGILKVLSFPDNLPKSNTAKIYLNHPIPEVTALYYIAFDDVSKALIVPRNILNRNEYFYNGNDLGYSYKNTGTIFKIWSPTALGISVKIYDYYNSDKSNFSQKQPLMKVDNGVWTAFVSGDLKDKYYLYEITQYYDGKIKTFLVQDPYSTGSAVNSSKSYIFDMNEVNFYVPGWGEDKYVTLKNNVDAILYELHVRDYTISSSSGVDTLLAGRYKGLAQYNTSTEDKMSTALNNLVELGITHVNLLPVFDYGTGNEAENNIAYTWYNWGYNPMLYNNVEGSYSSNPNGITRYVEYKTMIQYLHSANIGVVFDAVYNHTFKTWLADFSVFDKVVPYYFYRVGDDGTYYNTSGYGNDVATERPMVRKFIIDSVQYWVREYHVDGFRFDLMGIMDRETTQQIYNVVKTMNPNAILYGNGRQSCIELDPNKCVTPLKLPTSNIHLSTENISKFHFDKTLKTQIDANMQNAGIAAFNNGIHDSLIGSSVSENGYLQGNSTKKLITKLQKQIQGKLTGGGPDGTLPATHNESINYVSCHENLCFWDKLTASMPKESHEGLLKRNMLGIGIIMTSQGVPFIAEGEEFARTKKCNENSNNNNDPTINPINWNLKGQNRVLFDFYKGLIALRKAHPAFRMTDSVTIDKNFRFFKNLPDGVIAYALNNNVNADSWKTIIVGFNNTNKDYTLSVVGTWKIAVQNDKATTEFLNIVQNDLVIPAMSMLVAYGDYNIESFEF